MKKLSQEDKLNLLNETVEFYSNNPRSVSGPLGSCKYLNGKGDKCAIARLATPEQVEHLHNNYEGKGVSREMLMFLEWDTKDYDFYQKLQRVHDGNTYWKEEGGGVTWYGEELIQEFKTMINLNQI